MVLLVHRDEGGIKMLVTNAEKLMEIKETRYVVETWINPDKFEKRLEPLKYKQIEFDTYEEAETFADNFEALDKNYMAIIKTVRKGELK